MTRQGPGRICLVTPGHLATNPRLVKEADALANAGYEVGVIAADFVGWARDLDAHLADRKWKIVRTLPFGPDAPRVSRAIQLVRRRLARLLAQAGVRGAWIDGAAWHPLTPELVAAARHVKADLYIAHYPAALPAAAAAARRHGAAYAYDAEDFHLGETPPDAAHALDRRLIRSIEGRHLAGCAYVTAASPGIGEALEATYGIARPRTLLNVFPLENAPSRPSDKGGTTPGPSLYWFSQTIGPDRGLECAIRAVAIAKTRPHLYLRGVPSAGFDERLATLAGELGVLDRLHILPPAEPCEMERLASVYDVGLVGETGHTDNRRRSLTNKLFSYLLAGLPIVASDVPAHLALAPTLGTAMRLFERDDPTALAAALDAFLHTPEGLAQARADAFKLGQQRFNWDGEKEILLHCVAAALEREKPLRQMAGS